MTLVLTLLGFALLGGMVKFVDDAYDENVFSRRVAFGVAAAAGGVAAALAISDLYSLTLLAAILLAALLTGKIDNPAHGLGAALAAGAPLLVFAAIGAPDPPVRLLALLLAAGIADEVANDYVDSHTVRPAAYYFFRYRSIMKLVVAAATLAGRLPLLQFAAFLLFDFSYAALQVVSLRIKPRAAKRQA